MPIFAITLSIPLATRLRYACDDLVVGVISRRQQAVGAAACHKRLERQVRIDRIGPVADEQAVMMHLAGFARFQQ